MRVEIPGTALSLHDLQVGLFTLRTEPRSIRGWQMRYIVCSPHRLLDEPGPRVRWSEDRILCKDLHLETDNSAND